MAGDDENPQFVTDGGKELEDVEGIDDDEEGEDGGEGSGASGDELARTDNAMVPAQTDGGVQPLQPEVPQAEQPRIGGWAMVKTMFIRMFIIYVISSMFRRGGNTPPTAPDGSPLPTPPAMTPASNMFARSTLMDLYVYVTERESFSFGEFNDDKSLFWLAEELEYGDWTGGLSGDGIFTHSGKITISEKVQNNGTLYLHIFVVKTGHSPNPSDLDHFDKLNTIYKSKPLTKFKKRKYHTMKNLLTGTSEVQADLIRHNESSFEVISHWHPNLTINIIDDHTGWVKGSVPAPLDEFIDFVPSGAFYYPVVYFNDYWNLNQEYMPINSTTPWQMYAAQGMRSRWYSFLGDDVVDGSDDDQDSLKQAFLDTSPYLLAITVIVSIVHSVFEFLAFKNDIQFWRNRKSLEGLSVRSVFFNVFQSVIVLLYVMDNETNFVIKCSIFVGLGIEIWKIQKVIDIKVDRENKLFGVFPRISFQDKSTYTESMTKKYDMLAFKYLSWLLFPLLAGYAVYSVIYLEHKGWYSWVLGMIYGFLLTFGFIMMTPQLFINYKLKSIAHLPWRMLTYKALNTFIDDLFAFVIKMPMLYRLGCFRDDIVFIIYVYQRWIYRVDPTRVNEFGTSGEMLDENSATSTPAVNGSATAAIEDKSLSAAIEASPGGTVAKHRGAGAAQSSHTAAPVGASKKNKNKSGGKKKD